MGLGSAVRLLLLFTRREPIAVLSDSSATSWLHLVALTTVLLVETFVDLYQHVRLVCSSYISYI